VIIDEEVYLEHFGVKGMQWGVRRQRREARLRNVARGKVGLAGKAAPVLGYLGGVAPRLGPIDLIKGRGIRGAAQRKSIREAARSKRFKSGKAKVGDYLVRYGTLRPSDLIPVKTSNVKKKTIIDKVTSGQLAVTAMLDKK